MSDITKRITKIGVMPVIKLDNPRRDAAPLAKALCTGGVPVAVALLCTLPAFTSSCVTTYVAVAITDSPTSSTPGVPGQS